MLVQFSGKIVPKGGSSKRMLLFFLFCLFVCLFVCLFNIRRKKPFPRLVPLNGCFFFIILFCLFVCLFAGSIFGEEKTFPRLVPLNGCFLFPFFLFLFFFLFVTTTVLMVGLQEQSTFGKTSTKVPRLENPHSVTSRGPKVKLADGR